MKENFRKIIDDLPDRPGVYFFKNATGTPIYVGKALSIRKRVRGHFRFFGETFSKEGVLLSEVRRIDFIETPSEAEALLLEASLVREIQPKFNQELKDDKSYPFLKITDEEYPRLLVVRGRKADGGKYFGPYTDARLLRQAVRMLRREFPMRTCRKLPKKVCLMYHLGQCGGPCEGFQEKPAYLATSKELEHFLEGRRQTLVRTLSRRMKECSARRDYETAQSLYEEIRALSVVGRPAPKEDPKEVLGRMQNALDLPRPPLTIECFDISNISGREAVGSMVVFHRGLPARNLYRRFRVRTVEGIDDYRMMQEVVRRRYARVVREQATLPDLVVIDGGKGHLSAVKTVLDEIGLTRLPVISIAKQHEHIFRTDKEGPSIFPQNSPFLEMIRRLRDEAHRFAITAHRRLHRKEALVSAWDGVPGVGPKTREKLLRKIGPPANVSEMTEEEVIEKAGVNRRIAAAILGQFGGSCRLRDSSVLACHSAGSERKRTPLRRHPPNG